MFLAIYNCFQIPIIVAFSPEEHLIVLIFNLFTDLMFILDIGFNFRTSYIDEMGEEITDLKMIAKNYLRGDFVFDLLASLPID